jgi:hypothetical protein
MKRLLLWSFFVLLIVGGGAALGGYLWLQNYLKSDAIRVQLEERLGSMVRGRAELATLEWSGNVVYMAQGSLTPDSPLGWHRVRAEGVQAHVDWSGLREQVVRVPALSVDWLQVEMPATGPGRTPDPAGTTGNLETEADSLPPASPSSAPLVPGWLQGWLPRRTEIDRVEVGALQVGSSGSRGKAGGPKSSAGGVQLREVRVIAQPATDEGAWTLAGEGGELALPDFREPFELQTLRTRLDGRALTVNHAGARWVGDSEVTARGEIPFDGERPWKFRGLLSGLKLEDVLEPSWRGKLHGQLEADYEVDPVTFKADTRIKNAVVEHLPLLERVADFTRTDRFRRLVLEEVTAEVERRGDEVWIRRLVVQSAGLLRIEGEITLRGEALQGDLHVGVSNEALRWVPGAQTRVFTETRPGSPAGFVWTPVRLSGTRTAPGEDLSNRLLAAMGRELIEAPLGLATKGVEILTGAAMTTDGTGTGTGTGAGAVEAGKQMLKTTEEAAGKAVETGVELLKEVVPLFGR